jgi:hypothetical protein
MENSSGESSRHGDPAQPHGQPRRDSCRLAAAPLRYTAHWRRSVLRRTLHRYIWKSSSGTDYYIVDCVAGTKAPIFDNDELAALLTTVTEDPYDGLHLPIEKLKFVDADTLTFDVTSTQDEKKDKADKDKKKKKKVFHFAWTVSTQTLSELSGEDDYTTPDSHPSWASISPNGEWVVYARYHNLWMMRGEDYARVVAAREGTKSAKEAQEAEDKLDEEEGMEEIQVKHRETISNACLPPSCVLGCS